MTIHKRIDSSPAALPKTVAALRRDFEQEKASLGLARSTLQVGGETLVQRDGVLNFVDATGTDRAVVPPPQVTLIPNADFEQVDAGGFPLNWTKVAGTGVVDVTTDTDALSGSRALRVTLPAGSFPYATVYSEPFVIAPGSTVTIDVNLKSSVTGLTVIPIIVSNVATGDATAGASGAVATSGSFASPALQWAGSTASLTPPPAHTLVRVGFQFTTGVGAGIVRADAVSLRVYPTNYAAYTRRVDQNLQGGGIRTVNADGRIAWSEPLMTNSPGGPAVYISMPANATVIPVYNSTGRTSETVTGGFVDVLLAESLWYEVPAQGAVTDAAGNLRILGQGAGLDPAINERWIMVCANSLGLLDPTSPKFKWGDGRTQDPLTAPTLSNGWVNFGGAYVTAGYYRVDGVVYVEFTLKSGTSGAIAFTLPLGFRPRGAMGFPTPDGLFEILAGGGVVPYPTGGVPTIIRGSCSYRPAT